MRLDNLIPKKSGKITSPEEAAKLVELASGKEEPVSDGLTAKLETPNENNLGTPDFMLKVVIFPLSDEKDYPFFTDLKNHTSTYQSIGMDLVCIKHEMALKPNSKGEFYTSAVVDWQVHLFSKEDRYKQFFSSYCQGAQLAIYDKTNDIDFSKISNVPKFILEASLPANISYSGRNLTTCGKFKMWRKYGQFIYNQDAFSFSDVLGKFFTECFLETNNVTYALTKSFKVQSFGVKP